MTWIIPALVSAFAMTSINFVDKYIVEKEVKDYKSMPIFVGISGFVMGTIFWLVTGMPILPKLDMFLLIASGCLLF